MSHLLVTPSFPERLWLGAMEQMPLWPLARRLQFPETIWPKVLISLISLSPPPTQGTYLCTLQSLEAFLRRDIIKSKVICFNLNQFNTKFLEVRALGFSLAVLDAVFSLTLTVKHPIKHNRRESGI